MPTYLWIPPQDDHSHFSAVPTIMAVEADADVAGADVAASASAAVAVNVPAGTTGPLGNLPITAAPTSAFVAKTSFHEPAYEAFIGLWDLGGTRCSAAGSHPTDASERASTACSQPALSQPNTAPLQPPVPLVHRFVLGGRIRGVATRNGIGEDQARSTAAQGVAGGAAPLPMGVRSAERLPATTGALDRLSQRIVHSRAPGQAAPSTHGPSSSNA